MNAIKPDYRQTAMNLVGMVTFAVSLFQLARTATYLWTSRIAIKAPSVANASLPFTPPVMHAEPVVSQGVLSSLGDRAAAAAGTILGAAKGASWVLSAVGLAGTALGAVELYRRYWKGNGEEGSKQKNQVVINIHMNGQQVQAINGEQVQAIKAAPAVL